MLRLRLPFWLGLERQNRLPGRRILNHPLLSLAPDVRSTAPVSTALSKAPLTLMLMACAGFPVVIYNHRSRLGAGGSSHRRRAT
jgi:hypothetical protein